MIPYFIQIPPVKFEGTLNLKDGGQPDEPRDGFELCQMSAIALRDTGKIAKDVAPKSGGATGIVAAFGSAVELVKLERRIAYDAAVCDIESLGVQLGDGWFEIAPATTPETEETKITDPKIITAMLGVIADEEQIVARAVHYLELIGLLERKEDEPTIVRVKPLKQ